jgi:pimeloyl-ACP methyl ester carboxylesterase
MGLHYIRSGTGEPLVLIHPVGASLVVWEPVLAALAAHRDVVAVDMSGFGRSPPLERGEDPTPQVLARALAAFLDELGIEDAHLAGNSLGAWVALELAKAGRGRSVTGLAPAGFWARPLGPRRSAARTAGRALLPLMPLLLRTTRGRRLALGGTVARPDRVPPDQALRLVRDYVRSPAYVRANAAMRSSVFSGIEEVRVPVTLAWAEHDRLVTQPEEAVRGARSLVLRGCGHIPMWDDPDQVAQVLLEGTRSPVTPPR